MTMQVSMCPVARELLIQAPKLPLARCPGWAQAIGRAHHDLMQEFRRSEPRKVLPFRGRA